jgi:hypothetical protein
MSLFDKAWSELLLEDPSLAAYSNLNKLPAGIFQRLRTRKQEIASRPVVKRPKRAFRSGNIKVVPKKSIELQAMSSYGFLTRVRAQIFEEHSRKTPNYWDKRKSGVLLPMNAYSLYKQEHVCPMSKLITVNWAFHPVVDPITDQIIGGYYQGTQAGEFSVTAPLQYGFPTYWGLGENPDPHVWDIINDKLLEKLASQKSNLGEALAEGKQAASMITKGARTILIAAIALRRLDFMGCVRALRCDITPQHYLALQQRAIKPTYLSSGGGLRFLADTWLEFHYGWQPLLSDIHGTVETLVDNWNANQLHLIVKVHKTVKLKQFESHITNVTSNVAASYATQKYSGTIRYNVTAPSNHLKEQLGLLNPVSLAWNLLPYSFVADWFLDINSSLNQCSATAGLTFVNGCRYFTAESRTDHNVRLFPAAYHASGQNGSLYQSNRSTVKLREDLSTFPSPRLVPGKLLEITRTASLLALLVQKFHKQ